MRIFRAITIRFPLLVALGLLLGANPLLTFAYQGNGDSDKASIGAVSLDQLPAEARHTLDLIKAGGPFPYSRDGASFGNRERILPRRARGYYHEYTVATPGARNRAARRIIAGAPGEYYYTDDHYRSFRRIKE